MCIPAKRNGKGKNLKMAAHEYMCYTDLEVFSIRFPYTYMCMHIGIYIYISLYMYIFFFLQINSRTVRKFDREKKCPRIHLNLKHWILFSNQFTYVLMNKFSKIKSMQNFQSQINFFCSNRFVNFLSLFSSVFVFFSQFSKFKNQLDEFRSKN